jgi:DNA-binding NtrC family response regulator
MRASVLIADDEPLICVSLEAALQDAGMKTSTARTADEAFERWETEQPAVVVLDHGFPDGNGLDVLRRIRAIDSDAAVIVLTGQSNVELAVEATQAGAFHFVSKPVRPVEIVNLVQKALEQRRLRSDVKALAAEADPDEMVGECEGIVEVKRLVARVARSPATTVLITGESGTGKDLVARALHRSASCEGRLVNITCSAIPEALLESELFGHERGAFTDARSRKIGLVEAADGGTLFLDEIGEMPLGLQAKLLRFLESRVFRRIGGNEDIEVDLRVVAATNRDLLDEVEAGRFRADLYYRLCVISLHVPALRERGRDLRKLTDVFTARFARKFNVPLAAISEDAFKLIESHCWPGNVRELKNVIERAVLLLDGTELKVSDFPALLTHSDAQVTANFILPTNGVDLVSLEVSLVRQALQRTKGNRTHAAALLGLNRDQIRYRIEKYKLEDPESAAPAVA